MRAEKEIEIYESIPLDNTSTKADNFKLKGKIRSVVITRASLSSAKVYAFFPETQEKILLKVGVPVNFAEARSTGCVLMWEAQSGVSIDVQTSAKTHLSQYEFSISNTSTQYESKGKNFTQGLKTVTNVTALILAANENRTETKIINNSPVPMYFGTQANCNDANYKNLCEVVNAGDVGYWDNEAGLYGRTESTTQTNKLYYLEQLKA